MLANTAQVAGILTGNTELLGRSLDSDVIIEPVRGPLIPSFFAVKQAAKAAGEHADLPTHCLMIIYLYYPCHCCANMTSTCEVERGLCIVLHMLYSHKHALRLALVICQQTCNMAESAIWAAQVHLAVL